MAVSRAEANAAVIALQGLSQPQVKTMTMANSHMFDKHVSKAAADGSSWFEKVHNIDISNTNQWKELPDNRRVKMAKESGVRVRDVGAILKKNEKGSIMDERHLTLSGATTDIGVNGVPDLMFALLRSTFHDFYETDKPDRFVIAADMPAGYVGRGFDINGVKTKLPGGLVKIVVNASGSPQLVTAFPVRSNYNFGTALT